MGLCFSLSLTIENIGMVDRTSIWQCQSLYKAYKSPLSSRRSCPASWCPPAVWSWWNSPAFSPVWCIYQWSCPRCTERKTRSPNRLIQTRLQIFSINLNIYRVKINLINTAMILAQAYPILLTNILHLCREPAPWHETRGKCQSPTSSHQQNDQDPTWAPLKIFCLW